MQKRDPHLYNGGSVLRGFQQGDREDFADGKMPLLSRACHELSWLLDRDYPKGTARDFVGDRYQLTARQRLMLARAVSGDAAAKRREAKRVTAGALAGRRVAVDGFNTIVTLEVALSGGSVIACQDGTVRDLAGMRGTYHPCSQTGEAIGMLLGFLERAGVAGVDFMIDAPVSNSGRLRALVLERAHGFPGLDVTAELDRDVDEMLSTCDDVVITSDSVILDRCGMWFNAVAELIEHIDAVWWVRP